MEGFQPKPLSSYGGPKPQAPSLLHSTRMSSVASPLTGRTRDKHEPSHRHARPLQKGAQKMPHFLSTCWSLRVKSWRLEADTGTTQAATLVPGCSCPSCHLPKDRCRVIGEAEMPQSMLMGTTLDTYCFTCASGSSPRRSCLPRLRVANPNSQSLNPEPDTCCLACTSGSSPHCRCLPAHVLCLPQTTHAAAAIQAVCPLANFRFKGSSRSQ